MNRKKLEIIILPVVLVLVFVYSICYNYRFGVALYNEAIEVAYQTETFANSIDFTRKEFEQSSSGADSVDTYLFEYSINSILLRFGIENMPFLDEVRAEWHNQIMKFYRQACTDGDLESIFCNEEIYILRDQLKDLSNILNEFCRGYEQTPKWKRYFISWKDTRDRLRDQAEIILEKSNS